MGSCLKIEYPSSATIESSITRPNLNRSILMRAHREFANAIWKSTLKSFSTPL